MPAPGASLDGVPDRRYFRTPATAPGPAGPEMAAAFLAIRRDPLRYLERVWRAYGDVVQFPVPRPPSYLVVDPGAVRRVLVSNARSYGKRTLQYSALSLVTGEGLLTADTEAWRRQRRLVQPAFHHETLTEVGRHVGTAAGRLLDDWDRRPEGAEVDVDAAMMHTALEVVGRALFGTDLSGDAERLVTATLSSLDVVVARARVPLTPPSWVPTPGNRVLRRSVHALDTAVVAMVGERLRARRAGARPAGDMLDLLLDARDDAGEGLTTDEVRDQIVTFVVAGHETVASALTWAWWLLAAHPAAAAALQDEADAVLGGRPATAADLGSLPYARAVFDEALRLYPPAWLITRDARDGDVLGGREIPAGALVILSPWLVHRHPAAWPAAEEFRPERFLPGGDADRSAFLPFGAGPRLCIGRDFAYVEGVLLLASIAARYSLDAAPGQRPQHAEPLVTVRPAHGLRLRLRRRRTG